MWRRIRIEIRFVLLHLLPDIVRNGDGVAVEIQGVGSDDMSLGADADRCGDGLAGEHVCAVKVSGDYVIEQDFPVRLRDDFDLKAFVLEEAFFLGYDERSAIGKLDKAELKGVLFDGEFLGMCEAGDEPQLSRGEERRAEQRAEDKRMISDHDI